MKKGLNANILKLIAIIAMLLDHVAVCFMPMSVWYMVLRTLGRITMPIMSFFIAEGYFHTHDLKKYVLRLGVFAVISHFPYVLCFSNDLYAVTSSIMVPLLLGLCALWLYDKRPVGKWQSYALIVLCFLLSVPCDWSCMPVFLILLFGMYRNTPKLMFMRYSVICAIFAICTVLQDITLLYMGGLFLAIPLLALYSGERGRANALIKWGFYAFYPTHLLLLFFISCCLK